MNSVFYHYLSFVLTVLLSGALTLTILVFRKTGNRAYQLMSVYFATLLLAELFARDAEIRGMIYTLLAKIFHAPSLMTSLCYSTMVIALAELTRYCGGWSKHSLTILFATFFPLWFFCVLMLKNQSTLTEWLYILPYQMYTLGLSLALLRRQRRAAAPGDIRMRRLLILTAVFSVLIFAEDSAVALFPAAAARRLSYRSVTANLLQALYALLAIRFSAQELLQKEERPEPTVVPPPAAPDTVGGYGRSISLSAREQDVLALLLQGKNNREISAELGISQGTVKAHTHNIFQKSGTENRDGLTEAFCRHATGGGTGKKGKRENTVTASEADGD